MKLSNLDVAAIFTGTSDYPKRPPYHPPVRYPEFGTCESDPENHVYKAVRDLLAQLGLDKEHFGSDRWNPFGGFISPGMTVFIKPNTVTHRHMKKGDLFSIIVHGSVLRPILDYTCIALAGKGRIIIGDSQLYDSDFEKAQERSGIAPLVRWYRTQTDIPIECIDLRKNRGTRTILYGRWARKSVEQDPRGYRFVDLGDMSYFKDIDPKRLRIAIASHKNMVKHHENGRHEYLFPCSLLASDVIINVPKLKTHRRTGITLAIKNFMGLASLKDSLPHFTTGTPDDGGDQYIHPNARKKIGTWMHDVIQTTRVLPLKFIFAVVKKLIWNSNIIVPFKDNVFEAMWPGNDTVWRTLYDLNRIALFADKSGNIRPEQQRNYFCVMDGIIGGEGDGPLACDAVRAGVLFAGFNPVAIDAVAATAMGFDIDKIRLIARGFGEMSRTSSIFNGRKDDINVLEHGTRIGIEAFARERNLHFKAHPAWSGSIERKDGTPS